MVFEDISQGQPSPLPMIQCSLCLGLHVHIGHIQVYNSIAPLEFQIPKSHKTDPSRIHSAVLSL